MRICIVGAGSVGGYMAGSLAKAGREVSLITRGAHLDAIRTKGLTIQNPDETFTVKLPASDNPADLGPQDVVITTAKAPALPSLAPKLAPLLGPDTPVVHAMNGVFWFYGDGFRPNGLAPDTRRLDPDGLLHRKIGPERALGMVIYSPNEVTEPGHVHNGSRTNRFVLGDGMEPGSARERAIQSALDGCGFTVELSPQIRAEMWRKLAINVSAGPLAALTMARLPAIVENKGTRAISRALMEEALAVAAAHGFDALDLDPVAATGPRSRPDHKPSILQDLELGRPMEIDSMVAIVQDLARQANVPTPMLDIVLPLLALRAQAAGCYEPPKLATKA